MDQIIIHVDMDAFFASVEIRDDPSLRGKPLIIGSLPHERGVVATCSYEARKYGVHSAMNIKEAYRLCPHGVYMHPNFEKYKAVSDQLHEIWNTYATASQYIALDEAYLDVTQRAGDMDGARSIARAIKQRTLDELGLTCSVGVAYSKTAAKTVLYTVGEKSAEKLYAAGIRTVRDIRSKPEEVAHLLGKQGRWITQLAFGIDDRKVVPYRPDEAKSIGREVTFQKDVEDYGLLSDVLVLLSLCVEHRTRRVGLYGRGVTLKLTYADMKSISRSRAIYPTDSAATIYSEAAAMLDKVDKRAVRLVGVSLYNLSKDGAVQLALDGFFEGSGGDEAQRAMMLGRLGERYHLDFASNLEKIYKADTLHRTVEYMRRHSPE